MTPEENLHLNQLTEDSELLRSTLFLINRLREIKQDHIRNTLNAYRPTIDLLTDMSEDITKRLRQWPEDRNSYNGPPGFNG